MKRNKDWGNLQDNQTQAVYIGYRRVHVPEKRIWGIRVRKARWKTGELPEKFDTANGDQVPDDVEATRTYLFRCGLIKAINVLSTRSRFILYLDGYRNMDVSTGQIRLKFDDGLDDGPVAEICISAECTRYGEMFWNKEHHYVNLIFKDEDQMRATLIAVPVNSTPDSDPEYSSSTRKSSGDCSAWPLVAAAGFFLGSLG